MRRERWQLILMSLAAVVVMTSCTRAEDKPPAVPDPSVSALTAANNDFAVALYRQLASSEGNLFFSPFSVSSALGMTFAGARGDTAAEMKAALRFGLEQNVLHPAFRELNRVLAANAAASGQKLSIANGLCLTGGDVDAGYKALLRENYQAEVFNGDLNRINGWVENKTEGKIDKILEQLDPNSVCVILNAIYFKGSWESRFDIKKTREAPFQSAPGKQVQVPLMYHKGDYRLLEKDSFQAAALPYKGGKMSMVVLLPRRADGLEGLQKEMTPGKLRSWLEELDKAPAAEAAVFLPKFKMETKYDLVPSFKALGMKDAFDRDRADFSGMGWKKGDLWINQIKHRAFVEVNEEGTEAAASTAVEMTTRGMPNYPVFRADHAFIFLIRDNATGSLLFLGRVTDPTAADGDRAEAEKAILRLALRAHKGKEGQDEGYTVVSPETNVSMLGIGDDAGEQEERKNYIRQSLKLTTPAETALLDRLLEKNRKPVRLTIESSPRDGYLVDYDGKFDRYFEKDGGGWERWYKENPKAHGMTTISLPAYDEKSGLVLMYTGTQSHWLAGAGWLVLYKYEGGKLTELRRAMMWIS